VSDTHKVMAALILLMFIWFCQNLCDSCLENVLWNVICNLICMYVCLSVCVIEIDKLNVIYLHYFPLEYS
jgi:hypothetical protein